MATSQPGTEIVLSPALELSPAPIFAPTPKAARRTLEFFTAQVNNDHTRKAYLTDRQAKPNVAAGCLPHDSAQGAGGGN